jgi:hypothetical protein
VPTTTVSTQPSQNTPEASSSTPVHYEARHQPVPRPTVRRFFSASSIQHPSHPPSERSQRTAPVTQPTRCELNVTQHRPQPPRPHNHVPIHAVPASPPPRSGSARMPKCRVSIENSCVVPCSSRDTTLHRELHQSNTTFTASRPRACLLEPTTPHPVWLPRFH